MQKPEELTGEEIVEQMDPAAKVEAQEELSQLEPAGSEPFRIGDEKTYTETDEDPISEGGSSRKTRL